MRHRLIALIGALALTIGSAIAASPEDSYLAARDAYAAKFKEISETGKIDDAVSKDEDNARADLETQMRAIVGPAAIAGMTGTGKINLDSLFSGDEGYGMLDGMAFASADDKTRIIVTTQTLLAAWLGEHKTWWGDKVAQMPQDPGAAMRTEAFYTQAISTDAAVVRYGEVTLRKPDGASLAIGLLAARTQDQAPPAPDEIFVAFIKGGRVFVANAPLQDKVVPLPACAAIRADCDARAEKAFEAYRAGGLKVQKQFDRYTKLLADGERAFLKCFADKTPKEQLAKAAQQAQGLADTVAAAK